MKLMISMGVSLVVPSMTRCALCPALADLSVPLLLGPDTLTTDYVVSNTKQSSGNDRTIWGCFQAPLKTETFELEDNGKLLCV